MGGERASLVGLALVWWLWAFVFSWRVLKVASFCVWTRGIVSFVRCNVRRL